MSTFRKFSTLLLWAILIAAVVSGFLWFATRNRGNADPRIVLPESTAVFFEFNSFPSLVNDLQSNSKMWKELSSAGSFKDTYRDLYYIDSLFRKDAQVREFFGKRMILSVSLKANKTPGILFCLPVSASRQDKILIKYLSGLCREFSIAKRRYEGTNINDLSWKDVSGIQNFSFTILKGVLVGSFSSELVEEAVRQTGSEKNITTQPEFVSVTRTAGNAVPEHIFINYKNASGLFRYFLNPAFSKQAENIRNFASWGALDAELYPDKLILNGFSSLNDSLNQELRIFSKQEPVEFQCPEFLPEAVSFFKVYGFSDKEMYFKNLRRFRNLSGFKNLSGLNIDEAFEEMIGDEYGYAAMQSGRTSAPFFFMQLKSQSLAEQQFREWITDWAPKNGKTPEELMMDYKIDNNNTITVYKLPVGGIPAMVFGPGFKSPGNDYFTFINNYLVFANSFNSLKEFIYQVVLGNTLASGTSYSSLGENISSRSNFYLFAKPSSIMESSDELLSEPVKKFIRKSKESISKFNAFSIQYSAADDLLYSHIFLNFSGVFSGSVNTVWESRIDTSTIFKPSIVINHLTGEKEIMIQDLDNQLYLLSNAGLVLWKQMLDGPLKSEIFQLDYFKNGKMQYLFSTRNKIYLIDRNGNPVEKYPISLRSPATAGISLFDYDKDGTLRICVPCEDRKIYLYDKDGKIIPAWQPDRTDTEVSQPVQSFRVGSKDYIVAIDKYKFYILDRKGKNRVSIKRYFRVSSENGFYLDMSRGEELARLVATDTTGSIMSVYFSGKIEKILERKIDPAHFFVFTDLNGDQKGEFMTATGNILQVLDPNLKESFKIEFNDVISYRPVVYKFSANDNKIGIVLGNPGNIYLYNNNGSLYNGFPLVGSAPFSISSFPELGGRFNMIVGTKDNFLYNYSVQ
jgi:WD40 repeat protein